MLQGQPSFGAARATARATVDPGQTTATATLTGGMAGHVHPWHVHEGQCGSGGGEAGRTQPTINCDALTERTA